MDLPSTDIAAPNDSAADTLSIMIDQAAADANGDVGHWLRTVSDHGWAAAPADEPPRWRRPVSMVGRWRSMKSLPVIPTAE